MPLFRGVPVDEEQGQVLMPSSSASLFEKPKLYRLSAGISWRVTRHRLTGTCFKQWAVPPYLFGLNLRRPKDLFLVSSRWMGAIEPGSRAQKPALRNVASGQLLVGRWRFWTPS